MLVVVLVGGVGYAYITGMGPLEENPTAGLEEPPETEATYSFGEVPETGSGANGQVNDETETQDNTETDNTEEEVDEENGRTGDTETGTDSDEVNVADGDTYNQARNETSDSGDENDDNSDADDSEGEAGIVANENRQDEDTDDSGGDGDSHRDGGSGGVESGDDGDTDSGGTETTTLQTNAEYTGQPFVPELENMEECGETCREATVALQNKMAVDAENVVVYVRLYAGDSTDPEEVVWGENRELGTLGAGEVYRETETVDLTPQQANKVRETDGVVTAKATIESDQATATFVEQDDVE